jgi:hypothetical protein
MIARKSWITLFQCLLILVFLVALFAFAYVGRFTRYMADDYCLAAAVNTAGFIKPQVNLYLGWTGRYSYTFLITLAEWIGPATVPIGPSLGVISWLGAAVWSLYQIARIAQWPSPFLNSCVLAELIVFAMLNSTNNIAQSFYWQGGLINTAVPLIFLTTYVGIVSCGIRRTGRKRSTMWLVILSAMVTFVAGGFTEAFVFLQTTGLLVALIVCFGSSDSLKRAARPFIVAGLAGSLLALFVVVLAPGNSIRRSFFPPPPNLFTLTKLSLFFVIHFVGYTVYYSPLTMVLLLLLPALLGNYVHGAGAGTRQEYHPQRTKMLFIYLPLLAFILVLSSFVPGVYGTSNDMPGRAHMIPQFILVCATVYWGYLAGSALSARFSIWRRTDWPSTAGLIVLAMLILSVPLVSIKRSLSLVPRARESASIWDQMDQEAHAAKARGILDLTVPVVDDIETRLGATHTELNLERDRQNWKNRCAAVYYGINSIQGR